MATIMKILPLPVKVTQGETSVKNSLAEKGFMRNPGTGVGLIPLKQGGKYLTGLDPEAQYIKIMTARGGAEKEKALNLQRIIRERKERLEIETGLDLDPRGEYYSGVYGPKFGTEEVATRVRLIDGENVFNFSNPYKEIEFWWVSQCNHLIANSLSDWKSGRCASTVQFYISDPEAEATQTYEENQTVSQAVVTLNNLPVSKRRKIAKLLGLPVTDNTIEQELFNQLYTFISTTVVPTGEYKGRNSVTLFNTICAFDDTKLNVSALVNEAIKLNVIFLKSGVVYDNQQVIAQSKDAYIEELCNITKQMERSVLEAKVADKKRLSNSGSAGVLQGNIVDMVEKIEEIEKKKPGRPRKED